MADTSIPRYPLNASEDYIKARDELLQEEFALSQHVQKVAALRRKLPEGAVMKDYTFSEGPTDISAAGPITSTTLADLGSDGRSIVIYHLMFGADDEEPCPMCALWVDGMNGVAKHVAQHTNFAIIGRAPIEKLRAYAAKRHWDDIRILSSYENDFNKDMSVEHPAWSPETDQLPGISIFKKDGDQIKHVYSVSPHFTATTIRGMDQMSPFWNLLDLVPEGRGDKNASNSYIDL
jgi:predicted dithiol-disulfide oxidoreductase (DUF899 family)